MDIAKSEIFNGDVEWKVLSPSNSYPCLTWEHQAGNTQSLK